MLNTVLLFVTNYWLCILPVLYYTAKVPKLFFIVDHFKNFVVPVDPLHLHFYHILKTQRNKWRLYLTLEICVTAEIIQTGINSFRKKKLRIYFGWHRNNVFEWNRFFLKKSFRTLNIDSPLVSVSKVFENSSWIWISSSITNRTYANNNDSLPGKVDSSSCIEKLVFLQILTQETVDIRAHFINTSLYSVVTPSNSFEYVKWGFVQNSF